MSARWCNPRSFFLDFLPPSLLEFGKQLLVFFVKPPLGPDIVFLLLVSHPLLPRELSRAHYVPDLSGILVFGTFVVTFAELLLSFQF